MTITIALVLNPAQSSAIYETIEQAFMGREDGPWEVWLGPHEVDRSRWRLRLTCPGYTTTVSLGHLERSPLGLARRLEEILAAPVGCLEPAESA